MGRVIVMTLGLSALVGLLGLWAWQRRRRKRIEGEWRQRIQNQMCHGSEGSKTVLISSMQMWKEIEAEFLGGVSSCQLLSVDAEWNGNNKIALLQLSLPNSGLCVLLRTCQMEQLPSSIKQILEDCDVIKVGVGLLGDDQKKFLKDWAITARGLVDLRHLVNPDLNRMGVQGLADTYLHLKVSKDWRIRAGNWEAQQLTDAQVAYAANDAFVVASVLLVLAVEELNVVLCLPDDFEWLVCKARQLCSQYDMMPFKPRKQKSCQKKEGKRRKEVKLPKHAVRLTPLYHNARLEAPDGQQLCVCDVKKALWYVEKGLGELMEVEDSLPPVVRLNFEPSGLPTMASDKYYLEEKANLCVVCGKTDSYVRKYVVPHEYRRCFPQSVRDHQSHDVLLTCMECHQESNMNDIHMRRHLASLCQAPLDQGCCNKVKADVKKVRSAARALLENRHKMPQQRVLELQMIVLQHFEGESDISDQLLISGANLDITVPNDKKYYRSHGERVVQYFVENGEILDLEKKWRQHFLDTMKPRFLPLHWSVDHRKSHRIVN